MIKKIFISIILLITLSFSSFLLAEENPYNLDIKILSPKSVEGFPGIDESIKVKIVNNGTSDLTDVLAYITMADIVKNMTVNLEDYNADKPVYLESIKIGEEVIVELPVRFVYTSNFYLYVTVITKNKKIISSSQAISIKILGNTKIDRNMVTYVVIGMPILLISIMISILFIRKKRLKDLMQSNK